MTNKEALLLANEFKKTQSSQAFEKLWSGTVMMVDPYKYFDPTGARDSEDFLQMTRIGLWKAIESYQDGHGATILTWIRRRMTQLIIQELRKVVRTTRLGTKISLDTSIFAEDDKEVEALIYKQLISSDSYQAASVEWSEDLYWEIINDVQERLKGQIRPTKIFLLKLAFPHITRRTMSLMTGMSRPALSQYYDKILTCIEIATEKYALRNR